MWQVGKGEERGARRFASYAALCNTLPALFAVVSDETADAPAPVSVSNTRV